MSPAQYYILKQLSRGPIPSATLFKLDQRPLAGLFRREYFRLRPNLTCEITNAGWEALKECNHARYRKDASKPLFYAARAWSRRASA